MRIGTAALGREIEHAPHRPDRIDVAGVLAGFPGPEHQLGGVSVTDRTVRRPNKGVEDRPLIALVVFAVVVSMVAVGGR